jgi:hypothetical protein
MSLAVDLVKEAGPYVLGLAGIYATYRSGSSHGREARHHARVEKLYVEMLHSLDSHLRRTIGIANADDAPPPAMMTVQVRLYAPRNIQVLWHEALLRHRRAEEAWLLAKEQGEQPDGRGLRTAYDISEQQLVRAMSADLGVPTRLTRTFRVIYARVRRRRLEAEKASQ